MSRQPGVSANRHGTALRLHKRIIVEHVFVYKARRPTRRPNCDDALPAVMRSGRLPAYHRPQPAIR